MFSSEETQQHLDELRRHMPKLWEMIAAVDAGMYRVGVITGQCWQAPDGDHVLRLTLNTDEKVGLATTKKTEASALYRVHHGHNAWSRLENLCLVDLVCGGITRNFQVMDAVRKGQPIAPPTLLKLGESMALNVAHLQRINQELGQQIDAILAQRRLDAIDGQSTMEEAYNRIAEVEAAQKWNDCGLSPPPIPDFYEVTLQTDEGPEVRIIEYLSFGVWVSGALNDAARIHPSHWRPRPQPFRPAEAEAVADAAKPEIDVRIGHCRAVVNRSTVVMMHFDLGGSEPVLKSDLSRLVAEIKEFDRQNP